MKKINEKTESLEQDCHKKVEGSEKLMDGIKIGFVAGLVFMNLLYFLLTALPIK